MPWYTIYIISLYSIQRNMGDRITVKEFSQIYVTSVAEALERVVPRQRVIVITDANIDRLYGELVHRYDYIIVGHGEANKNLVTVQNVYTRLMELGADRHTFLLGIGGGIVTDITGYVAATYMRGIDFGFISTTLLGQVDASVGGKNGVNLAGYKNMIGTFRQPRFVVSDVELLKTLPQRELRAGMAEVIKVAVVGDANLFHYLEEHVSGDIYGDAEVMREVVLRSVRIKADIVERDECERGLRRLLNLGHTIGHAIEKCTREFNHGEAVAIGMSLMARMAERVGMLPSSEARRIEALIDAFGFERELPVPMADVMREIRYDKKKSDNSIRVVVPESIGSCKIVEMTFDEFEKLF